MKIKGAVGRKSDKPETAKRAGELIRALAAKGYGYDEIRQILACWDLVQKCLPRRAGGKTVEHAIWTMENLEALVETLGPPRFSELGTQD